MFKLISAVIFCFLPAAFFILVSFNFSNHENGISILIGSCAFILVGSQLCSTKVEVWELRRQIKEMKQKLSDSEED